MSILFKELLQKANNTLISILALINPHFKGQRTALSQKDLKTSNGCVHLKSLMIPKYSKMELNHKIFSKVNLVIVTSYLRLVQWLRKVTVL